MIKIGTSGFSFDDWKGNVYPLKIRKEDMLSYYENELGFESLEVNYTYYRLPSEKTMNGMDRKTSKDFEFVVKGYRGMTHDPFDNRIKERPDRAEAEENFKKFAFGIQPLVDANKLGAVLLQFPVFFYPGQESRDYLAMAGEALKGVPLVVEFRNSGWAEPGTYEFLRENNIGFCTVDEPKLPKLMPFVEETTSDISYLRFHGRNKNWFNAPMLTRYDYLYTKAELKDFVGPVKDMGNKTKKEYVFFNNCHSGSAVKNAIMMKELLVDIL